MYEIKKKQCVIYVRQHDAISIDLTKKTSISVYFAVFLLPTIQKEEGIKNIEVQPYHSRLKTDPNLNRAETSNEGTVGLNANVLCYCQL